MNKDIDKKIAQFYSSFKKAHYKEKDVLIRGDDNPTAVYLLIDGLVKMSYIDKDGRELAISILKPGSFFPLAWAVAEVENNFYFQALTSVGVVKIPKDQYVKFISDNSDILLDTTQRFVKGVDSLLLTVSHLINGNSTEKVAVIIYMLAKRFGSKKEDQVKITLPITHQDISIFAGLSRETTTLAIKRLASENIIYKSKRQITIKNLDLLKSYF